MEMYLAFDLFGRIVNAPEHVTVSLTRLTYSLGNGVEEADWDVAITVDDDSLPETIEYALAVARRYCPEDHYVVVDTSTMRCQLRYQQLDDDKEPIDDFRRLMALALELGERKDSSKSSRKRAPARARAS
jgi:hypothetical protein